MPKPAHTTHYVCTGGCGGVSEDPKATCQAEGCPLHEHPLVPCSCKDNKHKEVLEKRSEELKKLEETLSKERDRVNLIISSMGEGLLVIDKDTNVTMINPAAETLLQVKAKDVLGKKWSDIASTSKGNVKTPISERSFAKVLETGKTIITHLDDDHYYLTRRGYRFSIVSITAPLKRKNGEVFGAVKVFRDATQEKESKAIIEKKVEKRTKELRKTSNQLLLEQARLTASIKNIPLGFFIIDRKHNILLMNPAMRGILGSSRAGWTFDGLKKEFNSKEFDFEDLCTHCRDEAKLYIRDEIAYGDKILRAISVPIEVKKKHQITGSAVLVEDITEAKLLDRARDEFFSIASHELRTPLTAIRGNSSLIKQYFADKVKDSDLKEIIDDMHDSSIRLIEIVNAFLDVSRLEQGNIEFKSENFDLVKLIKESVHEVAGSAKKKSLYIRLDRFDSTLPKVRGDKAKIKQVLINLLGNAVKFSENGSVRVEVTKEGEYLKVWIRDTGIGILPETQKLLFRKFQQAGKKILTRDVTRGTGLGLYISKLLVEGMGGKIQLERTEKGKGSTFSFTAPVVKEATLAKKKPRG